MEMILIFKALFKSNLNMLYLPIKKAK